MKTCRKCNQEKPIADFYRSNRTPDGHIERCKSCNNEDQKITYQKHIGRRRLDMRNWNLKFKYGINQEEYLAILESQGGTCAICGGPPRGKTYFCVDHDHETGKVRGVVCFPCNAMLGHALDSTGILANAITYLENS